MCVCVCVLYAYMCVCMCNVLVYMYIYLCVCVSVCVCVEYFPLFSIEKKYTYQIKICFLLNLCSELCLLLTQNVTVLCT